MTNHVLLRNVEHKDLKILPGRGAHFGDQMMMCSTFPAEFRDLQNHYPIVLRATGDAQRYEPVVLFGFQDHENLFVGDDSWDATYVPMCVTRQPFLMGLAGDNLMVYVDLDHPKVSTTLGDPLFLEFGGNTETLERVNSTLLAIHHGLQSNIGFIATLIELDLIETFVLDSELTDGSLNRRAGFSCIHEEKFAALDGAALARLHQSGYLMAICMMLASMGKLRDLIERKNRRNDVQG